MTIDHRLLSCRQHAYNNSNSNDTALHELVGFIEGALYVREHEIVIILDIEGLVGNLLTKRRVSATLQGGVISSLL